jgi:Glyoxalase superfamily protein/Clp amino terminal domain, pathogenicity island component
VIDTSPSAAHLTVKVDTTGRLHPSGYGERIEPLMAFAPERRVSNASPDTPVSFEQRMQDMRDFRDAKVMARTLRAALAAKGLKITIGQSLELIAEAFGAADWNTLAAAIRAEAPAPRNGGFPSPLPIAERILRPQAHFSRELESTLHRALANANHRKHGYATLEHLLLALMDDMDASAVMKACNVDLAALKRNLASYVDNELRKLANSDGGDATPSAAFQRVIQRAVTHVHWSGREEVTGANVLVAIFTETESPAARLLGEQDMTREGAVNVMSTASPRGMETP